MNSQLCKKATNSLNSTNNLNSINNPNSINNLNNINNPSIMNSNIINKLLLCSKATLFRDQELVARGRNCKMQTRMKMVGQIKMCTCLSLVNFK
mmetsp:Transcript_16179/g.2683  ORF Transcript_16179/g.2683 Transcript_16179/m.2683 type:complete len:94 (+) Transcript_16179:2043-2324(+)